MAERLRTLLERPLDPSVARAMPVLALAVSIGFAAVALMGGVGSRPVAVPAEHRVAATPTVGAIPRRIPLPRLRIAGQDAQDRPRTDAHERAVREADDHRALQHVPWRQGGVSVEMIGAEDDKAVLAVEAPDLRAARRGWIRFLHRFRDDGRSYLPRFRATDGGRP